MDKIHDDITLSDLKKNNSKDGYNMYNMYNKRWCLIMIINDAYTFDFIAIIKCNDYIR